MDRDWTAEPRRNDMLKEVPGLLTSAALMLGAAPSAFAHSASVDFANQPRLDAPRGMAALANFRIPLGSTPDRQEPSFGLSFGFGRTTGAGDLTAHTTTRQLRLVDLRLDKKARLRNARVASFDLANLDEDNRLNLFGGSNNAVWLVGGAVLVGVGVCLLAECFDGNDKQGDDD